MSKTIIDIVQRIFIVCKTKVTLLVEPYFWRVEVLDQYPLTNVEFTTLYQERVFYVFLDYELSRHTQRVVSYIVDVVEATNPSTPRHDYISKTVQLGFAIHTFRMPLMSY
jgi:hypothetical protein